MTFSILARDAACDHLGIAICTSLPGVGGICPWIRHGVGAVVTQAWTNAALAPAALDAAAAGASARQALEMALKDDAEPALRQLGIVDARGHSAAHTGAQTDGWAGELLAPDLCVVGNMLTGPETLDEMAAAYRAALRRGDPLADRLLTALEAADAAGGDRRGKQSAALIVRGPEVAPVVDLRVDEYADPIRELRRVYEVAQRDLFPFVAAMPTRKDPKGHFERVRARILATPSDRA